MLKRATLVLTTVALLGAACSSSPLRTLDGDAGASPVADAAPERGAQSTQTVLDAARISSDPHADNFQQIEGAVDFSGGPFQNVTLRVDLASSCVPFASWTNNPPPKGQNWPADCDAFDRNFEISLDGPGPAPDAGTETGPALELVRAITPFGGPLHLEHDLTAVANALTGAHPLRVRINTWSDAAGLVSGSAGGWTVSLKVAFARGQPESKPLLVAPLFYGDLTTVDSPSFSFVTPEGTRKAYVEYRTTGHGAAAGDLLACAGPAEEFCRREHQLRLDGVPLVTVTPWRECASLCTLTHDAAQNLDYCAENPCGAIASVKAPRANWCPGSESPPIVVEEEALRAPGPHQLSWHISQIAEGGSVRVSATYFAFGD